MAPENELLSPWREELRQQANQGSTAGREEELEGGGKEQERETEMFDENSNVEKTITDSESEEQFRASLRREKKTGKRRGSVAVKMEEGMTLFLETSRWTCCAEFHLCVKNWVSVCDNS